MAEGAKGQDHWRRGGPGTGSEMQERSSIWELKLVIKKYNMSSIGESDDMPGAKSSGNVEK